MTMISNESVDHEAREIARRAEQKIDSHEDRCGERWKEARTEMKGIRDSLDSFRNRLWWLVGGVIVAQFAAITWLVDKTQ